MRSWSSQGLVALLALAAASVYFVHVPGHPPGFSIDESSICYNAYTISQTGRDEYGQPWPLFFRAFGEYKNPTIIYILAGLFRVVGPSIGAARLLTASFGVLAALLFALLAWQITRRWAASVIAALTFLLTPWLFESSRLVFEVAVYPALIVLFLITVWRCSRKNDWQWHDVFALTGLLALLTYSYSIGRLLGPLLAAGLAFFFKRERASALVKTWGIYVLLLVPLFLFNVQHPDALIGRFKALTYLGNGLSPAATGQEFVLHYLANLDPRRWLFTGEYNIRDHVQNTGALLAATVAVSVAGLSLILLQHRRDAWWRFVLYSLLVSLVPASLTDNPFPQLRLIAFPIFFVLLAMPGLSWLTEPANGFVRRALLIAIGTLTLIQGLHFQWRYHKEAPELWYVFDARFQRKVLAAALRTGARPIYLLDEQGKAGYVHALWYGALSRIQPESFVRMPVAGKPRPGSVVISTEEDCADCRLLARALNYIVYATPPYAEMPATARAPLTDCRAEIIVDRFPAILRAGQSAAFDFRIKNIGQTEWPALGNQEGAYAVKLRSSWLMSGQQIVPGQHAEKRLPFDVEPGDTVGLSLEVVAPEQPGEHVLATDLWQEKVGGFGDRGSSISKTTVQILPKE